MVSAYIELCTKYCLSPKARLQSLEIARRRFRKFNSKYIESIKNARRRSFAHDAENAACPKVADASFRTIQYISRLVFLIIQSLPLRPRRGLRP